MLSPGIERGDRDFDKRGVTRESTVFGIISRQLCISLSRNNSSRHRHGDEAIGSTYDLVLAMVLVLVKIFFNIYVRCHWKIPDVLLVPLGLLCATSHRASLCLFQLERFK